MFNLLEQVWEGDLALSFAPRIILTKWINKDLGYTFTQRRTVTNQQGEGIVKGHEDTTPTPEGRRAESLQIIDINITQIYWLARCLMDLSHCTAQIVKKSNGTQPWRDCDPTEDSMTDVSLHEVIPLAQHQEVAPCLSLMLLITPVPFLSGCLMWNRLKYLSRQPFWQELIV